MNNLFEQMLSRYPRTNSAEERNAQYEVLQQVVLAGLYRAGFFRHAAFYGGTCLRIFHGLNRFSEDMDFSLLRPDEAFRIEDYFGEIQSLCEAMGRSVEITKKDKKGFSHVESAFLKDTTDVYNVAFQTEKSIRVKIEVDTCPPLLFRTEQKLLMNPFSFMTNCMTLSDLYAGKMHALVFRNWKTRVKGRDWYDFEWYVRNGVRLDWSHLHERICQFNGEDMSWEQFLSLLRERLSTADIQQVRADVAPFIIHPQEMDIWSKDYFLQLADMVQFE